jgi:hypothetical protein
MSSLYKNPITASQSSGTNSVSRNSVFGNNFSILNIGGYVEVYSLSDLGLILTADTYPSVIQLSANTIPINFTKGTGSSFSPDIITLNSDNISSGRRRLGMQVFVQETGFVYQYIIPNYETLWNNLSGLTGAEAITQTDYTTTVNNLSIEGQEFIDAWKKSTIEGVNGVLREDARWVIYQTIGYNIYTKDGALLGDRIVDLSAFTLNFSSSTYSNSLVLSGGNTSINSNLIVSAETNPIQIINLSNSENTRYIVSDDEGILTYRTDVLTGSSSVSAVTLSSDNILSVTPNGGSPTTTTINAATGGTYSNGTITLLGSGTLSDIMGLNSLIPTTLYSGDGTLTADRIVNLSTFTLNFSSDTQPNTLVLKNNYVGVGISSPTHQLHISGDTEPIKIEGLVMGSDTTLLTTDDFGVVHTLTKEVLFTDVTMSGLSVYGDAVFHNNVLIIGTATTYNQQNVNIETNFIGLNSNLTGGTSPYPGNSGLKILRGNEIPSIIYWSEPNTRWEFGLSGGTTYPIVGNSGTTNTYIPLLNNDVLSDSFLNQPDSSTLKTTYLGDDKGLKLHFTNKLYQFGDYNNINNDCQLTIEDNSKWIGLGKGFIDGESGNGVLINYNDKAVAIGNVYSLGDSFVKGMWIGQTNELNPNIVFGDNSGINDGGNKILFSILNTSNKIFTSKDYNQIGLNLDFANNLYQFGDFNYSYSGTNISINDDNQTITIPNGYVGIGTSLPTNQLHISGDTNPLKIEGLIAGSDTTLLTIDSSNVIHTLNAGSLTASTIYTADGSINGNRIVDLSTFTLNFSSDTQPNTLSLNNNYVGVGTSSPTNQLHISGDTNPLKIEGLIAGSDTTLLTIDGSNVIHTLNASSLTASTIYTADGSLSGDRIVDISTNSLNFSSSTYPDNLVISGGNITISGGLKLNSTTQGFLFPRMTESERTSIISPDIGLMVYQTDGDEGLYIYKSFGWVQII